jgi:anti-anti-sigma factor
MLNVRPGDGPTTVAVAGEVDVCNECALQHALLQIMREHGARLLLDLSGVSFIDCAGLQALLLTQRRAELRGGFMRLTSTSAWVRRIIDLTGTGEALAAERSATEPARNCSAPGPPMTASFARHQAAPRDLP